MDAIENHVVAQANLSPDKIQRRILMLRGVQVMLAPDLALLYNVPTKRLNEQVKRNIGRFPDRFMFQLDRAEMESLRSQNATTNNGASSGLEALRSQNATSKRGGTGYLPYASCACYGRSAFG